MWLFHSRILRSPICMLESFGTFLTRTFNIIGTVGSCISPSTGWVLVGGAQRGLSSLVTWRGTTWAQLCLPLFTSRVSLCWWMWLEDMRCVNLVIIVGQRLRSCNILEFQPWLCALAGNFKERETVSCSCHLHWLHHIHRLSLHDCGLLPGHGVR